MCTTLKIADTFFVTFCIYTYILLLLFIYDRIVNLRGACGENDKQNYPDK